MKTIMEKLRRNRGETLIESLCAILVIALIGAGFCASVMAVVKITERASGHRTISFIPPP